MKKFKYTILGLIVASMTLTSCDHYLDINENPNNIHAEAITPTLLFPGAVAQTYRTQATWMNRFGGLMMNSYAGNSYSFGSPFGNEYTLNVDSSFYPQIWDGLYRNVSNFVAIEKFDNSTHKYDNYLAAAKVMKAFYMQTIVDLYGDAPYSEAFMGQANATPKYDNDEEIYRSLILGINDAITIIDNGNAAALELGSTDIVFQGDMDNWKRLANTVKLRLLVRMSKVTGSMATFRDQQLQTLSGADFVESDVLVNPGYSAANDDQQNPFFGYYVRNSSNSQLQNNTLFTASEHVATCLNGNPYNMTENVYQKFNGIIDGRRGRMFSLITYNGLSVVKGVRQGATPGQPGAPTDLTTVSRFGNGWIFGAGSPSSNAQLTSVGSAKAGVIMTRSESDFLQAEAALRYPSVFSFNGQTKFESGIKASFDYLYAATGASAAYITAIQSKVGLGWTGTNDNKIEAIMTQKWLATAGINPTESFIDYNRTGFPITPMATTSAKPNKPYRLMYPSSEYVANSANVPQISNAQCFTKNQTTPFWNQN
ncbi:SusD/RagB family nutrient-binding outer membrane lipoprotein [Chryseobacterium aureum]|uniref:SusD/RagB family nutrient-binding outer membrane lipoprotein n=1 Tax=Chryseobacterium aureum TaxID=2497456 RepID=UPI000F87D9C9|nr:SusD/RagB family nutrient-binding outer membrane lipoprotein [Chryseobacterium aureum]